MGGMGFTTGLRALLTAQHALDTVGNNIANANTPGYSRQTVQLASGMSIRRGNILIGSGVVTKSMTRVVDALLNGRITSQLSVVGKFDAQFERAAQVQSLFGDLQGVGVGKMLDNFFSEVSGLSTDPSDKVHRTAVVQSAEVLAARLNEVMSGLAEAKTSTKGQASIAVAQINDLAERIADLNASIAEIESGQVTANALRDERQLVLEELSQLTDVHAKDHGISGLRVHVGGALLVDGVTTLSLELGEKEDGSLRVSPAGSTKEIKGITGKLGALLGHGNSFVSELQQGLDNFAHDLIFEVNSAHSTGVPGNDPFKKIVGAVPIQLAYPGGLLLAQSLAASGLPFDVKEGTLSVNVHETSTGAISKHDIAVGPGMSVGALVDALGEIPHLEADIDDSGHLVISSELGYAFDFSNRLVPDPDIDGVFGGGAASIGSIGAEPFALAVGNTLDFSVTTGAATSSFTYTANPLDFADITQATAEELADALNGDAGFSASGLVAVVQDGHVFVQTASSGPGESITLTGGTAAGALGWTALVGQAVNGSDDAVDVHLAGNYTGDADAKYTFLPVGEGIIGTTPGLAVQVLDANNQVVATLEVGAGYVPGSPISIGNGLTASFGLGELSASAGDRISFGARADSDTSDVLVALGVNTLFTGSNASDIAVRDEVANDPGLFAASHTGAGGDNGVLLTLLDLQNRSLDSLGGRSLGEHYADLFAKVGFEVNSVEASATSARAVLESLQNRRDSVSGVNVDEELVDMIRFEQAFQAATRYISVLDELQTSLLNIL